MRNFIILLLLALILGCTENNSGKKTSFDYQFFESHTLEKLNMKVKLPEDYKIMFYNAEILDSMLLAYQSNPSDQWKLKEISTLYKQQKGKVVSFNNEYLMSSIVFHPMTYTPINEETAKQIGYSVRYHITEANKEFDTNFELSELKLGNAGENKYAMYHISSIYGHNYAFLITQGYQSWVMNIYNDQVIDYQAVIHSITFP